MFDKEKQTANTSWKTDISAYEFHKQGFQVHGIYITSSQNRYYISDDLYSLYTNFPFKRNLFIIRFLFATRTQRIFRILVCRRLYLANQILY